MRTHKQRFSALRLLLVPTQGKRMLSTYNRNWFFLLIHTNSIPISRFFFFLDAIAHRLRRKNWCCAQFLCASLLRRCPGRSGDMLGMAFMMRAAQPLSMVSSMSRRSSCRASCFRIFGSLSRYRPRLVAIRVVQVSRMLSRSGEVSP